MPIQPRSIGRLIDREGLRISGKNSYVHMQFTNQERLLLTRAYDAAGGALSRSWMISRSSSGSPIPRTSSPRTSGGHGRPRSPSSAEILHAAELRRYMNRMILEFSRINTLSVTRTPYNQYESVILPMRAFLEERGVEFINNRKVTEMVFADSPLRVTPSR